MSSSIEFEFNENEEVIMQDLEAEIDRNPNFDYIVMHNVPSAVSGLKLILNDWFKPQICELPNVFGIILKTDECFAENICQGPRNFDFSLKSSFLVAFQSNVGNLETIIYWKFTGVEEFRSIVVCGDVSMMLCDFLIQEIKDGRSGIKATNTKKKIKFHEIVDQNQSDLLTRSVFYCQLNEVITLLKNDFIADNAIDLAWNLYLASDDNNKARRSQIVLAILKANSCLPVGFKYEKASEEIQIFIGQCENLHRDIGNDDMRSLKTRLDAYPNLNCFYDRNNQSLLAFAIRTNKTEVFKKFARRLNTGSHEDIMDVYKTIQSTNKRMIRKRREEDPFNYPQTHLLVLKSRTKISSNDQSACKHWEYIDEAYQTINSIEYCSVILQVAAECKAVTIFFDFKHKSTYYLDPATSINSKGVIYEGGTIYIGAQELLVEELRSKVHGVIVHEFCHLAVYLAFMNRNFDPFPTGQNELMRRFDEQVMVQSKLNEERESIIRNVFKNYPGEFQNSEMIVTYPQILMLYYGNDAKINEIEENFSELVKYSMEIVKPELIRSLKVLKYLNDESRIVKYENLTVPMKAKILHTKIDFQGTETTYLELIRQDERILKALSSDDIKKILLKHESNKIGDAIKLEMEYGIICRNFEKIIEANQNDQEDEGPSRKKRKSNKPKTKLKTFEEVRDETQTSKIFLLADHAGSGKTTIFKDCAKKLKEFYKDFWVSFVNLRKHSKVFEEYKEKIESLTLNEVAKILKKIVDPKSELEASMYSKLFNEGRTIFLFDGVDEISPIYTELLLKIFTILNQMEPKNQLWISTRPHYAQKLSETLNILYHKFKQYKATEINNFIKEILKFHIVEDQDEYLEQINECMQGLKGFYYQSGTSKEIENPLMVQMVAELYIEKRVDPANISRYGVYEAMVEKQKEKVGEKIPYREHNQDNHLNIWDIHRVLALILIIGDDYKKVLKFKLEDLEIMKKWKEEKPKWTSDMIQRYGFVIVDLSSENVDRTKIDFMHRTYAEFFITQIFTKILINDNSKIYSDLKLISLLFKILTLPKKFYVIHDFLLSFLNDKKLKNEEVNLENIRMIYSNEIQQFHQKRLVLNDLKEFSKKYANIDKTLFNSKTLNELWKLDKKTNLLEEYFKSKNMEYDSEIIELAEECFGSNWHEKFNKSGIKLITDEEIAKLNNKFAIIRSLWNREEIRLKFCDLVNKNYKIEDKKQFYLKNDIFFGIFYLTEFQTEFISRAHNSFSRTEFCEIFFLNANLTFIKHESLKLILNNIENDFKNDEDLLQKLLFENPERSNSPLCQAMGKEKIVIIKDFYIKHKNSWKDIQDILVDVDIGNIIKTFEYYYSDFKELVINAFGTDFSRLAVKFEDYINDGKKFEYYDKEKIKDFLNLIFHNNTEKVTNMMNNVL